MGKPQMSSQLPEGTFFDKPGPDGPPTPLKREIPSHLGELVRFFESIIADEGLLLDLCVDRAVGIVEFNYKKRLAGADFFSQEQPTPMHFVGLAAPLAVELYKQALQAIKDRTDEYGQLLEEAQREAAKASGKIPIIHAP